MEEKNFITCKVNIVVPKELTGWTYYNQNKNSSFHKIWEDNFYKAVNKIVELGGYLCLNKDILSYDTSLPTKELLIKIPEQSINVLLESKDFISACVKVN